MFGLPQLSHNPEHTEQVQWLSPRVPQLKNAGPTCSHTTLAWGQGSRAVCCGGWEQMPLAGAHERLKDPPRKGIPNQTASLVSHCMQCSACVRVVVPKRWNSDKGACQAWDFRFRISDLGFQIPDFRLRISDSRFQIPDLGLQIPHFGLGIPESRFQILDSRLQIWDFRFGITDSRFQTGHFGLEISDSGIQISDLGFQILYLAVPRCKI